MLVGYGYAGIAAASTVNRSPLAHHARLHLHKKVTKRVNAEELPSGISDHCSILLLEIFILFLPIGLGFLFVFLAFFLLLLLLGDSG